MPDHFLFFFLVMSQICLDTLKMNISFENKAQDTCYGMSPFIKDYIMFLLSGFLGAGKTKCI